MTPVRSVVGQRLGWLWVALVLPSLSIVRLHGGLLALVLYLVGATVVVLLVPRLPLPRSPRVLAALALLTLLAVVVAFAVVYPRVNVHTPHAGSDDDDSLNAGVMALVAGHSPYGERTYLGNVLMQLPGAFVLAAPFVALGSSALQNLFWLPLFFLLLWRERRGEADADTLRLAWTVLAACPVVLDEIVTGTDHSANAIYVLLGLWWLVRTRWPRLAGAVWGVALASRPNFLVLLPLAFGVLQRRRGSGLALAAAGLAATVAAAVSVPFYLASPETFGPLSAAGRLAQLDTVVPHAGVATGLVMAVGAVWLAGRVGDEASLFAASAAVLVVPVLAGVVVSVWRDWRVALAYAGYGLFASWFVLMWLALSSRSAPQQSVGPRRDRRPTGEPTSPSARTARGCRSAPTPPE